MVPIQFEECNVTRYWGEELAKICRPPAPPKIENQYRNRGFQIERLMETGTLLMDGWEYDYRKSMKKFVFREGGKFGQVHEAWAPSENLLRKAVRRVVTYVLEIPKKHRDQHCYNAVL
jgi:hypothetical protein